MSMTVEAWPRLDHPRGQQPRTKQQIPRVVKKKGCTSVLRGFVLTLLWYVMTWPSVMAWGLMMQHVLSSQTAELTGPWPTVEGKKNSSSWQKHKHIAAGSPLFLGTDITGDEGPGKGWLSAKLFSLLRRRQVTRSRGKRFGRRRYRTWRGCSAALPVVPQRSPVVPGASSRCIWPRHPSAPLQPQGRRL